ncbi:MAG: tetratricopeptide repeat protein [Sandaracinaceae bacterium]|nr:tetratricopeptide repeat protein [Sandaracinaceae bacterium]
MRNASGGLARAVIACALVSGCAHGGTVLPPPLPPPGDPPDQAEVERWEEATAVFARHEAAGAWDGEACREALEAFERVSARGQRARAVYMNGLVAQRCGNDEGARQLFTRALELESGLCEARVAIGLLELDAGRTAPAREAFEQAVRDDNRCATGYVNLAVIQSRTPAERGEAIANLRRALAVQADFLPALNQMARIYLEQSEERPELLSLAAVVCRQAQLIDASYAPIYNTWALIDLAQGDLTRAVAKLDRAVTLDPTFYEAWMNFGQITLSQRAYDDAARAFGQARALRPESYDAAVGLGVALRGLSRPDDAEQSYRAALDLDGDRAEAWFDLAVLYHEHRDGTAEQLRQALELLGEFVQRARGEPTMAADLQDTLRWCGEPQQGRRARSACRPGRAEVIVRSLDLLGSAVPRPAWTVSP